MAGHGGTVSGRTANKKLTKLYCASRKRSSRRLIILVEPKTWRDKDKHFSDTAPDMCPPPTFKSVLLLLDRNEFQTKLNLVHLKRNADRQCFLIRWRFILRNVRSMSNAKRYISHLSFQNCPTFKTSSSRDFYTHLAQSVVGNKAAWAQNHGAIL